MEGTVYSCLSLRPHGDPDELYGACLNGEQHKILGLVKGSVLRGPQTLSADSATLIARNSAQPGYKRAAPPFPFLRPWSQCLSGMNSVFNCVMTVPLTLALAQPTKDVRVPRNRAVVMLVVDTSASMGATDVPPTRLEAAKQAAQRFARQLTPGVNLGLISFSNSPAVLVSPSPQHNLTVDALDNLRQCIGCCDGHGFVAAAHHIGCLPVDLRFLVRNADPLLQSVEIGQLFSSERKRLKTDDS